MKTSMVTLGLSLLAIIWAATMLTAPGQLAYAYVFFFLEFYAGVFTLLLLTATVVGGLISTDRLVLSIKHRVLLQSAHRMSGVAAVGFLVLHIATKISMGKASLLDVVVPFLNANRGLYVGLGTIASYLMLSVFWTGIIRARFVGNSRPWLWRGLHSISYLSWPVSIMHGLTAGRAAATWVTASYLLCLLLVTGALFLRLAVGSPRSKAGTNTGSINSMKPIGKAATGQGSTREVFSSAPVWGKRGGADESRVDVLESSGKPERRLRRRRSGAEDYQPTGRSRRESTTSRWDSESYAKEEPRSSRRSLDDGYIDLPQPSGRVTEQIPVAEERQRREAAERPPRREAAERPAWREPEDVRPVWREPEDVRPVWREPEDVRPVWREPEDVQPIWRGSDDNPVSGPPRHRLVEGEETSYPSTNGRYRHEAASEYAPSYEYEPFDPLPPDDTPTLVDMASRRALRASREVSATSSRRGRRRKPPEETVDDRYWVS